MILMLTALSVEQDAVLEHLVDVEVHKHSAGTLFDVGSLAAQPNRRIALGVTGPGTLSAAALTERAIAEFSPTAVMFVGVAGRLRSWLEIGDVVVATKVYAYHGGRSQDDEFLVRPQAWDTSHELGQAARRLPRKNAWHAYIPAAEDIGEPAVYFDPIAAGEVLLDSTTSEVAERIRRNYNDAVAIEMESSGFAVAGHLSGRVPSLTIRGISDHADGTKGATDRQGSQRIAARNAAAFAVALAASIDDADDRVALDGPAVMDRLPQVHNTNIAHGGSRVGQQNGINLGGLHQVWGQDR